MEVGGLLALAASSFGVFGLWAGGSTVLLLADLSRSVGLSTGTPGAALFTGLTGVAASMVSMWSLGWMVDRFGRRAYLVAVVCAFGFGVSGLTLAGSFVALVAVFVLSIRPRETTTKGGRSA